LMIGMVGAALVVWVDCLLRPPQLHAIIYSE
jgi:hypothetical protein